MGAVMGPDAHRIVKIDLDYAGRQPLLSPEAEQERIVAVYDLIEENTFNIDAAPGPYHLVIRSELRHIHFDIRDTGDNAIAGFFLALGPFRKLIRDYRMVCENYFDAIRTKTPEQIQAIDMGRRAMHDEGAAMLTQRLAGKARLDHKTARRLFTLICALKTKAVGEMVPPPPMPVATPAPTPAPVKTPQRILFACNHNMIRSPMAEALARQRLAAAASGASASRNEQGGVYIASCGIHAGALDGFTIRVMREIGLDVSEHTPRDFTAFAGRDFDLVVAFSDESNAAAAALIEGFEATLEHWHIDDAALTSENADSKLTAYRAVRDAIAEKIAARFQAPPR